MCFQINDRFIIGSISNIPQSTSTSLLSKCPLRLLGHLPQRLKTPPEIHLASHLRQPGILALPINPGRMQVHALGGHQIMPERLRRV